MRLLLVAVALIAAAAPMARADDPTVLTVEVGHTVLTEVGYAMGHICDDETVVRAEMRDGTAENNVFVVTGLKVGTTMCRAGVVENRPQILFEIHVVEPAPAKPAPKRR